MLTSFILHCVNLPDNCLKLFTVKKNASVSTFIRLHAHVNSILYRHKEHDRPRGSPPPCCNVFCAVSGPGDVSAGSCLLLAKAALPTRNLSFLSVWVQFFQLDYFMLISQTAVDNQIL